MALAALPSGSLISACTSWPDRAASDALSALQADLQVALRDPEPAVLALGETHDNAAQHRLRLGWLASLAERGARFCVAMEQFDLPAQPLIDTARKGPMASNAQALARAAGFRFDGWQWPLYEPAVTLALSYGLPLVAANLPAADTGRIARGQPHALAQALPVDWRPADEAAQRRTIADGHCGLLPAAALPSMARAQRARDAAMAQAVVAAIVRYRLPVVLLAGNGHVRRDLGVPRYLAQAGHQGRVLSVGLIERDTTVADAAVSADRPAATAEGYDPIGHFDWRVLTPAQPRTDPCEALRRRVGSGGGALLDRARPVGQ